jgi:hypothetical protein
MNHDLDLESMSVDQLWSLHEMIASELNRKITAEKEGLEREREEFAASLLKRMSERTPSADRNG